MSSSPYEVLVFDVAANVWSKLQPPMRRFLRLPSLVELGGGRQSEARVRMVAAVEKSRLSVPAERARLDPARLAAAGGVDQGAVARMPPDVHEQFAATEGARGFECACSRHADRRAPLQRICLSSTLAATSGAGRRRARTRTPGTAPGSGCSPTSPTSRRRPSVYSAPRRRWPCTACRVSCLYIGAPSHVLTYSWLLSLNPWQCLHA
jgi:hypothetical protein